MKTVNKRLTDLEALQVCPVYDDFEAGRRKETRTGYPKLFVNDWLCCSLKLFTGQTRHKKS
jgi:hypothetical protein